MIRWLNLRSRPCDLRPERPLFTFQINDAKHTQVTGFNQTREGSPGMMRDPRGPEGDDQWRDRQPATPAATC